MTKLLSSNDDVSMYQLKWIEWKGKFSPVVTQVGSKTSKNYNA